MLRFIHSVICTLWLHLITFYIKNSTPKIALCCIKESVKKRENFIHFTSIQNNFTSSFIYYIWLKTHAVFYDIKKCSCITEFFKIKTLHLFISRNIANYWTLRLQLTFPTHYLAFAISIPSKQKLH